MSNESKVSARSALARLEAITAAPPSAPPIAEPAVISEPAAAPDSPPQPTLRIQPEPSPQATPAAFEQSVRYTVEMPKSLHRRLKGFVLDNETTSYAVTNALVRLLLEDDDLANRVRELI
ncbi:MAG: hypothetical protein M3256_25965 [Actinomycetota bacterium]|nr:hypothetical protein [Candidatus Dormibacteraeota bacterium]MDQ6949599.1 hypothetical protein [Actinomycetota bacterium]